MTRPCSWFFLGLATAACAGSPPASAPVPEISPHEIATRIYLMGDAGAPRLSGEPVLEALSRELAVQRVETVVVFLGDNAYPKGLPEPQDPERAEAERSLLAQLQVVERAGVKGYFVLGNHDWDRFGKGGWEAALRQERYIDSVGWGYATLKPGGGCPGPSIIDIGTRVRLLLLDTQWWLHGAAKPMDPTSSCPTDSEQEIVDSLRSALQNAGARMTLVAAHHPLSSGGPHGGYFGWEDHIFPLRLVEPWLWLPLPFIGSLYPSARQHGLSSQDMSSRAYQRLIAAFRRAFSGRPPDLYAAGHEHNLQVIAGGPVPLQLVSGGGIYQHTEKAANIRGTLYAKEASGFARLDVPSAGPARLAVLTVTADGQSHEVFSTWVK
ncbi:MAG TPA: metallophosphoesterase [Gemmatimonadales bacterium]|nr:metallophosphoesterase [Gemmatimonadales bacterium]